MSFLNQLYHTQVTAVWRSGGAVAVAGTPIAIFSLHSPPDLHVQYSYSGSEV